jgi:hypothetical protein
MTSASEQRRGLGALGWIALALVLMTAGAAAAVWALANNRSAARFLGVTDTAPAGLITAPQTVLAPVTQPVPSALTTDPRAAGRIAELEARLSRVENATQRAEGSAGRADALLVAFAARRAIDRGVALGYLESMLVERFNAVHPQAVATVITASRTPVRLDQLTAEFNALAPGLKGGGPDEGVWQGIRRELSSLIAIRRAHQPSSRPNATYDRAAARLAAGQVSEALAEAMRLPGIERAPQWVARARTYVAGHRALDEIESTALLGRAR